MLGKIFFLLFFLLSCEIKKNPVKELKIFEAKTFLKLSPTFKIKIFTQDFINSEKPISSPIFTAQSILEFKTISNSGEGVEIYCLIYRIPSSKGEGGWLKVTESSCAKKSAGPFFKLAGVSNLYVHLSHTAVNSSIFGKIIKPFHLGLIFLRNGEKQILEIPLLNLSKEEITVEGSKKIRNSSILNARFSNGITPTYSPGIIFFPLDGVTENGEKVKMIGELEDNFLDGTSKICHQVNERCETVGEFKCNRCRYGWFETVPTKCLLAGDKYCGVDRCGEKGWPACPRGFYYPKKRISLGCEHDHKAAFCQNGLRVFCDPKGVLICD